MQHTPNNNCNTTHSSNNKKHQSKYCIIKTTTAKYNIDNNIIYRGGVAQWLARLTRDRCWIPVSLEFESHQRPLWFL